MCSETVSKDLVSGHCIWILCPKTLSLDTVFRHCVKRPCLWTQCQETVSKDLVSGHCVQRLCPKALFQNTVSKSVTVTKSYVGGWRECSAYAILGSEHLNTLNIQRVVDVVVVTMVCHELGHARINENSVQFTKPGFFIFRSSSVVTNYTINMGNSIKLTWPKIYLVAPG